MRSTTSGFGMIVSRSVVRSGHFDRESGGPVAGTGSIDADGLASRCEARPVGFSAAGSEEVFGVGVGFEADVGGEEGFHVGVVGVGCVEEEAAADAVEEVFEEVEGGAGGV